MYPTMIEVGERFRDHLLKVVELYEELEMKELCARFTTDIIGTCAFGIECNSLNDPNAEFRHYGRKIAKQRHAQMIHSLLHSFKSLSRKLHVKMIDEGLYSQCNENVFL